MRKPLIYFIFPMLILVSCMQENKNKTNTESNKVSNEIIEERPKTAYKIPSPVELYMFMNENNIIYQKSAVNSVENIAKYYTNTSKALNFGIYASDLAYCAVYGMHQETFLYFSVTRTLATDLGFTSGFDELMVNRINANLYNGDSLFQITTDSYADACNYLEETGKSNLLALVLAGSWIESMQILIHSIETFSPEDPIISRLADQRFLLDNLVEYYKSIDSNMATDKILNKLYDIQSSFDLLYDNPEDVVITQTQYNEIADKINTLRNELVI